MLPEATCRELVELVTDYLEGASTAATIARVDAHLARCADCRTYVAQMRHTIRALGALPPEPVALVTQRDHLRLFRRWRPRCEPPPGR